MGASTRGISSFVGELGSMEGADEAGEAASWGAIASAGSGESEVSMTGGEVEVETSEGEGTSAWKGVREASWGGGAGESEGRAVEGVEEPTGEVMRGRGF
jgi:hypothetical protein